MIEYPGMLVDAAKKAGMEIPPNPDEFVAAKNQFPHFFCFCMLQLGTPVPYFGAHFGNAQIIAKLTSEQVRTFTARDFVAAGFLAAVPVALL